LNLFQYNMLFWAIVLSAAMHAQSQISYTTEDGLPSDHVYYINQDVQGNIWLATNRGIAKFNGEKFKIFTLKEGLPNNDIWRLEPDAQGRMWYFSKSNYQGYILNDSVYSYPVEQGKSITPISIFKIDNSMIIGYYEKFKLIDSTFKITLDPDLFFKNLYALTADQQLVPNKFFFECPGTDQTYYLRIEENEVTVFDEHLEVVMQRTYDQVKLPIKSNISLVGGPAEDTFLFANEYGALLISLKHKKMKYFKFSEYFSKDVLSYVKWTSTDTQIQLGAFGNIMIFSHELELLSVHREYNKQNTLTSFKDQDGNIWKTNLKDGVSVTTAKNSNSKRHFIGKKAEAIGVMDNQVVIGLGYLGFYKLTKEGKEQLIIPLSTKKRSNIYHVKSDSTYHTNYLIADEGQEFEYRNDSLIPLKLEYMKDGALQAFGGIKDIVQFKNNRYIVNSRALFCYVIQDKNMNFEIIKSGLSQLEFLNERLFIGGTDGLFTLDSNKIASPPISHELTSIPVSHLESHNNQLFVGTNGRGVYVYTDKKVTPLVETDGLMVQKMVFEDSVLWLATQNGVKRIELDTLDLEHSQITNSYYKIDGLLQNNINDICFKDGLLYAATDQGVSVIDPYDAVYQKPPRVVIDITDDTLIYEPGSVFISIDFSVIDYGNIEHVTCSYRLLPTQNEWRETESKTLDFTSLKPNGYTLEVKATDQHGNEALERCHLAILPYWWQTSLAKTLGVLCGLILLFGFYRLVQIRTRTNETKKNNRIKDLSRIELQALRSQMNPHFVHNSLNSIQYYIQQNDMEQSENYLTKFSRLIRLFFEYSRKQQITIQQEIELLHHYLEIEHLRFEDKLSYSIITDDALDADEQNIPTMILQPIVENAVNHGIFHKSENGNVSIQFQLSGENSFMVRIKDDGVGYKKVKEFEENSHKNYASRSLVILEERLRLLKQSKEWEVFHSITDLSDHNSSGTLVELNFKQLF
jgi:two-component sensor histidine kinase